jgi:hypothetical protein
MSIEAIMAALPPSALTLFAVGVALYVLARMTAEISERFAEILGPLGRKWIAARDRRISRMSQLELTEDLRNKLIAHLAETDLTTDLQRQITALSTTLVRLRKREALTDAYLAYDHNWHRRNDLGEQEDHISFLEFERRHQANNTHDPGPG